MRVWPDASVKVLGREISDHSPILLHLANKITSPTSFKNFDSWLNCDDFSKVVKASWISNRITGRADISLKEKLKKLKNDVKEWAAKQKSESLRARESLKQKVLKWDSRVEAGQLTDNNVTNREGTLFALQKLEQENRENLKQKSMIRWAVEGDENSRYFQAIINKNYRKNNFRGVMSGGIWCDNMDSIKRVAFSHFSTRFVETCNSRSLFRSSKFRRLTVLDALSLESAISTEEVRKAVWSCSGSKAPGPDGSNASFISLVPKVQDPIEMCDYPPISLIGCAYKVIAKKLATRLSKVMSKIISPNQTAFISGRKILDGVLIANEIVSYAKKVCMKLLFKVDFEKAFDCINWRFLLDIMMPIGFGKKWCKWIHGCLSSASISVLVNGPPNNEFSMKRGLCQGDPLYLFLFLIVAEALQVLTLEACEKRDLSWIYGIGVPENEVERVSQIINCSYDKLPLTYLRLPVGKDMSRVNAWNDIVESFTKRLSS
ncbi:putative RNA-directed DNA polymerase [Tanacetum coccineum]